jgi:hypothetical protein
MMRKYTIPITLTALVCALLLVSVVVAQSGSRPNLTSLYTVTQGTASGGGYRLASPVWQISGISDGGGYHLLGPTSPGSDNQCCYCTYLPCTLRSH